MKQPADAKTDPVRTQAPNWLIILGLILPTITTYIYFYVLSVQPETVQKLGMALCKIVQFGLPVFWVIAIRHRWPVWKGISADGMGWGFLFGIATFVVALVAYYGWLQHTVVIQTAALEVNQRVTEIGFSTPLAFIGLGTFYVILHSLLEEYYWRWFVFGMLQERMNLVPAIAISSLGFMSHHVLVLARFFGWASLGTWFFSLCVAVGGAFWAWLYHKTGRLYPPWCSHAIVDAGIFVIGFGMLSFPS